jgi:hypothetical protein
MEEMEKGISFPFPPSLKQKSGFAQPHEVSTYSIAPVKSINYQQVKLTLIKVSVAWQIST